MLGHSKGASNNPLHRILSKATAEALRAAIVFDFVFGGYGRAYGVTALRRAWLVRRFQRNTSAIPAGTSALSHVVMAREILSIPLGVVGDVVECGVWKGASSASLSLVCRLVQRRLLVCDSFAGLPGAALQPYIAPHSLTFGYLKAGMFQGTLPEVRTHIQRLGDLGVCDFVPGLFADTLGCLTHPVVFAFLDVDLPASFRDCLQHIWPRLVDGGAIYADDVGCMNVASVFFDALWWQQQVGCAAPGLVGSGCGLPLHPRYSNIGYTRKFATVDPTLWQRDADLYYPERVGRI